MSNLIPHVFNDISIRTTEINGQIWFVAADVCKALEINNPSDALKRLDDDERLTLTNSEGHTLDNSEGIDKRVQSYNIINESGLYSLILRSRKAEAKRFKKWITAEVLPSIRKTGSYHAPHMNETELAHWQWSAQYYADKIGHDQTEQLRFLMRRWIERSQLSQQTAYNQFHAHMNISRTDQITRRDFQKAMDYLHLKSGGIQAQTPAIKPTWPQLQAACLDESEQFALSTLLAQFRALNALIINLQYPLQHLEHPHAGEIHDRRQTVSNMCHRLQRFA